MLRVTSEIRMTNDWVELRVKIIFKLAQKSFDSYFNLCVYLPRNSSNLVLNH